MISSGQEEYSPRPLSKIAFSVLGACVFTVDRGFLVWVVKH